MMWQTLYNHLKANNIDVYPPNVHTGECKNSYTVVTTAGASKMGGNSSQTVVYDFLCYTKRFADLEAYVQTVRDKLKTLQMALRDTENETPAYYDDEVKAYMISMQYQFFKQK